MFYHTNVLHFTSLFIEWFRLSWLLGLMLKWVLVHKCLCTSVCVGIFSLFCICVWVWCVCVCMCVSVMYVHVSVEAKSWRWVLSLITLYFIGLGKISYWTRNSPMWVSLSICPRATLCVPPHGSAGITDGHHTRQAFMWILRIQTLSSEESNRYFIHKPSSKIIC